ncbi:MAG: hypothetical protein ABSA23_00700 [Anaerolineales bacterium]|jgi:hypothetical protein
MNKNLLEIIFKGVAVAMGIAVIVLNIIGALAMTTGMSLLGIGLTALAVGSLSRRRYSSELKDV